MRTQAQTRELLEQWQAERDRLGALATEAYDAMTAKREAREKAWKRAKRAKYEGAAQAEYERIAAETTEAEQAFDRARMASFDALHACSHLERMMPATRAHTVRMANDADSIARLLAPCPQTGAGHRLSVSTSHGSADGVSYSATGAYCQECRCAVYISEFDAVLAILHEARLQGLLPGEVPLLPASPAKVEIPEPVAQ